MSELEEMPDYLIDGLRRFVNAFYAHTANSIQSFFPLDLKCHLYAEGSWQEQAINSLLRTTFKDVSPSKIQGQSQEHIWGLAFGLLESASPTEEDEAMAEFVPSTYIGEKMESVAPDQASIVSAALDSYLDSFNASQQKEFTRGKLKGMESLYDETGAVKYESDRTEAYMLMLFMEDQLRFLDSWQDFHKFVSTFIDGYRGADRFAACKKMAQQIGFSPSKKIHKSCQNGGTSSLS